MRFLTSAWHAGEFSDERSDELLREHRAHATAVLPRLPVAFRAFAESVSIHDALVRQIRLDRRAATLQLDLRAGDQQVGYFDLGIRYSGVLLDTIDIGTFRAIAQDPDAEALYDEADAVSASVFEHRWLWWPYRELVVRFADFAYQIEPRGDRRFDRQDEPYVDIIAPVG
jgi:hypothetical protein